MMITPRKTLAACILDRVLDEQGFRAFNDYIERGGDGVPSAQHGHGKFRGCVSYVFPDRSVITSLNDVLGTGFLHCWCIEEVGHDDTCGEGLEDDGVEDESR